MGEGGGEREGTTREGVQRRRERRGREGDLQPEKREGDYIPVHYIFCLLCSRLPAWMRSYIPKIFYVEEKAWNFYPYTVTGQWM